MSVLRSVAVLPLVACARAATPNPIVTPALDRAGAPQAGETPAYRSVPVAQLVLSNGLRVWIVERETAPVVEFALVLDAGATRESSAQAGLASLTSALLTDGTVQRSSLELADQVGFLGAELSAGANADGAIVTLSALQRNMDAALELLCDVVQHPAFSDRSFERVRQRRLSALLGAAAQPQIAADQEFGRLVYGEESPYGRPAGGTPASLGRLTNADVKSFYEAFYHPDDAVLVAVGAVHATTLVPMLERRLRDWRPAGVRRVAWHALPVAPSDGAIHLIDRPGSAQSEVRVGFPAIARHDSTYAALTLANAVLGNFGRIWRALREQKGYAYTAGSVLDARRDAGALRAFAAVQTGVTAQALSDLLAVLRDATGTQPITDEELVAARVRLFRNEPFAFETNAQVASRLEGLALRGLDAGGDDTFLRQLGLLTRSDVLSAVARFSVRPTIVVVGDRSRIEGPLRALGLPVRIVTPGSKK